MEYNKLVRDKIPEIIKKNGEIAIMHIAKKKEYEKALMQKLQEEINEFTENSCMEEMADILEVIYSICEVKKFGRFELETLRKEKAKKRGGFKKRIILEKVV